MRRKKIRPALVLCSPSVRNSPDAQGDPAFGREQMYGRARVYPTGVKLGIVLMATERLMDVSAMACRAANNNCRCSNVRQGANGGSSADLDALKRLRSRFPEREFRDRGRSRAVGDLRFDLSNSAAHLEPILFPAWAAISPAACATAARSTACCLPAATTRTVIAGGAISPASSSAASHPPRSAYRLLIALSDGSRRLLADAVAPPDTTTCTRCSRASG
jgi:hypothetical protein